MDMEGLMQYVDEEYKNKLRKLIALKATVVEKYLHQRDEQLHGWIINLFEYVASSEQNLLANKADISMLNEFFLKILYAKTNH